jgi:hypothetical protein
MSQQPIYFWQLALMVIGGGLILHSVVSKDALLAIGGGKAVRLSQSVLGITLAVLALSRFLH